MKKHLLISFLLSVIVISNAGAQLINNNFESWKLDTFYFAPGTIGNLPADTTTYYDPIGWTSSNVLTNLDSIGGRSLVIQSSTSHSGVSAIQMTTDTILLPVIPNLPYTKVNIPGFVVNGSFDLSSISFGSVGTISPMSISGSGTPVSQRLATINGYYNYSPVFNTNTQFNDTCIVWATLRKGTTKVADAIFKSTVSTAGYLPFSANFVYYSCEVPDTLAILLASSVPNVYSFLGGATGLQRGSRLLIDSIYYTPLPLNHSFAPFAKNDVVTVFRNTTSTINVLVNDTDCSGTPPTVSIVTNAHHGNASISGNKIVYTPITNYVGLDSIFYKDTNLNGDTADALLIVFVTVNNAINEVNEVSVSLFPVPASNEITIQLANPGKWTARIYDMVGNLIKSALINNTNNIIAISELANGLYAIQIVNEEGAIVARRKFTISK